ncbi:MAG: flotillin-like protein FloA [Verrucomicrobia bacterium]|nr:flotillin-like protein FloA [Verrucomicrobiota bacterium]
MPQFAALPENLKLIIYAVVGLLAFIFFIVFANFGMIWIRALTSGAKVKFSELIALRLRRIPVGHIVDARITAVKSGIQVKDEFGNPQFVSVDELSTHYLAGGGVDMVVQALINAQKAGIHLDFDKACAVDLATKGTGKTVIEAVRTSVNPKVIDCPAPASGKFTIDAVAKDGIIIKARARVTVRTNLDRFVGGATEETIIARVGEGIVTTIGSAQSYKDVLENPDRISKTVLDKGLDSGTAFEILSIDIADLDVGENVGAKLQAEQAEANKLIAQAQAEVRRAAAVALEQEMLARTQEMRARVVEAEAQIPMAMAEAFRAGNLGVMDYYKMKNVQADTGMRESIGGPANQPGKTPGQS